MAAQFVAPFLELVHTKIREHGHRKRPHSLHDPYSPQFVLILDLDYSFSGLSDLDRNFMLIRLAHGKGVVVSCYFVGMYSVLEQNVNFQLLQRKIATNTSLALPIVN